MLCMQGALGTVAEQNQTTGQGARLVDVLCGEESDTPQGSEPVAKQARTDVLQHERWTSDSANGARKRNKGA